MTAPHYCKPMYFGANNIRLTKPARRNIVVAIDNEICEYFGITRNSHNR